MGRQGQGALGEVGQGRGAAHPDLDDPLDAQAAELDRGAHQLEGLDPAHRGGELPGEQLDQQRAGQVVAVSARALPVGQHAR